MMSTNSKLSFPLLGAALAVVSIFALSLLTSDASAAQKVQLQESSSSISLRPSALAPGAKPPASAGLKSCVSARYYDGRRIVFSGRMEAFTDKLPAEQTLQMRFDVYRKVNEQRKFKRLKGTGLGQWLAASDPAATVYIRELSLQGVETAAIYKSRVKFRWLRSDGTVEWRRTRTTKPCKQRIGLPRLVVTKSKRVPISGSNQENFVISVFNAGKSEAVNVPLFFKVDDGAPQGTIVSSIGPRQSADASFNAPACQQRYDARIDPEATLRLVNTYRAWVFSTCPRDPVAQ